MRKAIVSALMMTLLVLPGCSGRERAEAAFDELRRAVTEAQSITAQVEISANYGGTVSAYTVDMAYDGQETAMEILAPATIAGIRASARQGETSLVYADVALGAGALDEEGLTPMSVLPVMLDAMASAYVELVWRESGYVAARLYVGEASVMTIWLDGETNIPVSGEISSGGETVVACQFKDWKLS